MFDALAEATKIISRLEEKTQRERTQPVMTFGGSRQLKIIEGKINEHAISNGEDRRGQIEFTMLDQDGCLMRYLFVARGRALEVILGRPNAVFKLYCEISSQTGEAFIRDLEIIPGEK